MLQQARLPFKLSLIAQEEEGHGAGAGVGADDRTYIANNYILNTVLFLQLACHILSVFDAIAMGDKANIVSAGDTGLSNLLTQSVQRGLSAPGGGDLYQMAFVIHVHHRLDLQHGAHQRGGCADTAAPL